MIRMLTVTTSFVVCCTIAWAVTIGDDGLHKPDWLMETFLNLPEDLMEASSQQRRMLIIVEQRGCVYCSKMHEEVFTVPEINTLVRENYFVIQLNMFGDLPVVDFDGSELPEKEIVRKWGILFTPTMIFLPPTMESGTTASQAAVATIPGAIDKHTTVNILNWVYNKLYLTDEPFQKYHARILEEKGMVE